MVTPVSGRTVTLPSTAGTPAASFKNDLDAAREVISTETTHGHNVVVIAHSYGIMVGNSAIKGFTQPQVFTASKIKPRQQATLLA